MQEGSRFYGFGNYYLSSIQQGIQAAHVVGEMFVQNSFNEEKMNAVFNWAKNDKTIVLLNGGNSQSIAEIYQFFTLLSNEMNYPFAKFYEDQQSLNGALTCVGIILPKHVYELMSEMRSGEYNDIGYSLSDIALAEKLAYYPLAS